MCFVRTFAKNSEGTTGRCCGDCFERVVEALFLHETSDITQPQPRRLGLIAFSIPGIEDRCVDTITDRRNGAIVTLCPDDRGRIGTARQDMRGMTQDVAAYRLEWRR